MGICMRCRSPICQACRTRVRGINHCHACLRKLAQPVQVAAANRQGEWFGTSLLVGAAGVILMLMLHWAYGGLAP